MDDLFALVEKYGTDKSLSEYTHTYSDLFTPIKDQITSILEIGIGTLNPEIPSSFCGNIHHFNHYKPGGSLRVWRDYFKNAQIYGADIDKDILFQEDRIKTYYVDQLNTASIETMWKEIGIKNFDIIILGINYYLNLIYKNKYLKQ